MDRKLVSSQYHEPAYIAKRFRCDIELVHKIRRDLSKGKGPYRGRAKIYAALLNLGYTKHPVL